MIYQILGICKDCKLSKHCLSSNRGLACNRYRSVEAEKLEKRQAEMERILRSLKSNE